MCWMIASIEWPECWPHEIESHYTLHCICGTLRCAKWEGEGLALVKYVFLMFNFEFDYFGSEGWKSEIRIRWQRPHPCISNWEYCGFINRALKWSVVESCSWSRSFSPLFLMLFSRGKLWMNATLKLLKWLTTGWMYSTAKCVLHHHSLHSFIKNNFNF